MRKHAVLAAVVVLALFAYAGAALACECETKCPMMVKGAKVEVNKTDKGVTITVTADDPAAAKEIQARADKIGKEGCGCKKDGKGEGHKCPHAKDKEAGACGSDPESKCPHAK